MVQDGQDATLRGRRDFLTLVLAAPALMLGAGAARARTPEIFATDGIAVHGADVVAYFRRGRAVDGRAEFTVKWQGAMWRFENAGNMEAFEMDPRRYAPQYGGYCAYAMAKGEIAPTVPEAWTRQQL